MNAFFKVLLIQCFLEKGLGFPIFLSSFRGQSVTTDVSTITIRSSSTITTALYNEREARPFSGKRRVQGPSIETKPNYDEIHGPFGKELDSLFLQLFRSKMESITSITSPLPKDDYQGLMDVATQMSRQYSKEEVRMLSRKILQSLFPSWLPSAFRWMFAAPFPEFSGRMNAYATFAVGQWLMGECQLINSKTDQGIEKTNHGVLVKRCRFLEESGCASVCVNACKLPTQDFFIQDMGLQLTMTPNYETFECEFKFGLSLDEAEEKMLLNTPCLGRCSMATAMSANPKQTDDTHTHSHKIPDDDTCHLMIEQ